MTKIERTYKVSFTLYYLTINMLSFPIWISYWHLNFHLIFRNNQYTYSSSFGVISAKASSKSLCILCLASIRFSCSNPSFCTKQDAYVKKLYCNSTQQVFYAEKSCLLYLLPFSFSSSFLLWSEMFKFIRWVIYLKWKYLVW